MLSAIPSGAGALHQQGQVHRAQHMNLHQIKLNSNLHSTCNCFSNCVEKQEKNLLILRCSSCCTTAYSSYRSLAQTGYEC